jgi:hypothetical protein
MLVVGATALAPNAAWAGEPLPVVVPEPTAIALFAVGAAAVAVGLRLRKNR